MRTRAARRLTRIALLAAGPITCAVAAVACPPGEPWTSPPDVVCQGPPEPPPVISEKEHRAVATSLREAIAAAIIRDAEGNEATYGKKVITDTFGEELATIDGFTRMSFPPRGGRTWIDARDAADHPGILVYRIRWFNGTWSKWHIPGVNDRDWKDPTGRVWRYFTDHEHEYVVIDKGGPLGTRQAYICFNP